MFRTLHSAIAKTKRPKNNIFHIPTSSNMDEDANKHIPSPVHEEAKKKILPLSAILLKEAYLDGSSDNCACPLRITTNLGKFNLQPRPTPELLAVDDTNNNSKNNNEESFIDSDNNLDDSSAQEGA